MNSPQRVVYLSAPEGLPPAEDILRFRLIYDGTLQPSQRDPENGQEDPIALHKQKIRKVFHGQLKRLWHTNQFLTTHKMHPRQKSGEHSPGAGAVIGPNPHEMILMRDLVPDLYQENGYRFLPLVREEWHLLCELDILFLRRDRPGSVIQAGDIDNRIKTLIDSLRKPKGANELIGSEVPEPGEDPFFVLMEDDKQVSSLTVETDDLLDPIELPNADNRRARVVITVNVRPYYVTTLNLSFG
ncbi:MAG: hypothetical protein AAF982_04950 [Pseudomonadota bacterium]